MVPAPRSTRWCFTLNNPTQADIVKVSEYGESTAKYLIYGNETGESGTPHLQGFVILNTTQRLSYVRQQIAPRAHWEIARGNSDQARDYCKKDGDFNEFGTFPGNQGRRSDIELFVEWAQALPTTPTGREIATAFPSLFVRYSAKLFELVGHIRPRLDVVGNIELRDWQVDALATLEEEANDRTINFYVDAAGGKGKSTFVRYMVSKKADIVQCLMIGKRDDLAYAIDPACSVFLFDIPRGQMEFLQYSVLEMLKNRMVFSGKYNSTMKLLEQTPHVSVFCNEQPDVTKMTVDRYNIINLH